MKAAVTLLSITMAGVWLPSDVKSSEPCEPCPLCSIRAAPNGYQLCPNTPTYVLYSSNRKNQRRAQEFCGERSGILVEPYSQAVNDCVNQIRVRSGVYHEVWLGFKDNITEGHFLDHNGDPPLYTHWKNNDPDNDDTRNCVEIWNAQGIDGYWNPVGCNESRNIVCQWIP